MSAAPKGCSLLFVNGARLLADRSGALLWPERRTLIVADLHLEKGSAFAAKGQLLPPYDTAATLAGLGEAAERHGAERVVCLGDSFHDGEAAERLSEADGATIRALTRRYDWIWICGNHDPAPPAEWGGRVEPELVVGALLMRHEAKPLVTAPGEVSGHFHPKAAVTVRSRRLTSRCFVTDGRRIVLPAFGAYTGGLNVLDPAVSGLFPRGFEVHLLGRESVFAFPRGALSA